MEHRTHAAMKKALKNRAGRTQVEVLAVFVLLILLGVSAFTLSMAGADSYKTLNSFRDKSAAVRIALAYSEMKIHQYDTAGVLRVEPHPGTGESSLVIRETVEGKNYETWVYFSNGYLREALVLEGQAPTDEFGFEVVALDSYALDGGTTGNGVTVKAQAKDEKGRDLILESFVAFRSGEVRQ